MNGSTAGAAVRSVSYAYRTEAGVEVEALHDVSAEFPAGRVSVISGATGAGKTTLLRLVAALDQPTRGQVEVAGIDLASSGPKERRRLRRTVVAYVFQQPEANLFDYLTCKEHVAYAARLRGGDRERAARLLDMVGLAHRRDHRPAQLSGGEQQRLAFAAAACGPNPVVVADEPTAELDVVSSQALIDTMDAFAAEGRCLVLSSHDPMVIAAAGHHVQLEHGRSRSA